MKNLWEDLFKLRDKQREALKIARCVVKFKEIPWELNRQGKMKWYLHPSIKDTAHHELIVYVQEIPPGSRSGKVHHQGGTVFYIWKGKGYSFINNRRFDWEGEDLLILPIDKDNGITYQHFNSDPSNLALLIYAAPNVVDSLGVDVGIGLEQLENCPEWEAEAGKRK